MAKQNNETVWTVRAQDPSKPYHCTIVVAYDVSSRAAADRIMEAAVARGLTGLHVERQED